MEEIKIAKQDNIEYKQLADDAGYEQLEYDAGHERLADDTGREKVVDGATNRKLGQLAIDRVNSFDAENRLREWSEAYRDTEIAYKKYKKHHHIRKSEFEKWEDDIAYNYQRMQELEPAASGNSRYERDMIERIGALDPYNTVEADAGYYHRSRQRDLIAAIEEAGGAEHDADIDAVSSLYQFVGRHIYYERDYETKRSDLASYNKNRQDAHNDLIHQLNYINDLARKYHVRPYTPRNFEDNDFSYDETKDLNRYTDSRADYDRTIVEGYCKNAFSALYRDDYDLPIKPSD